MPGAEAIAVTTDRRMETDLGPARKDKSPNGEGHPRVVELHLLDTGPGLSVPRYLQLKLIHSHVSEGGCPTTIRFHPVNCYMNRRNLHLPIKNNISISYFILTVETF